MKRTERTPKPWPLVLCGAAILLSMGTLACGSGSKSNAAAATPTSDTAAAGPGGPRGGMNRGRIQTSIAQGTPAPAFGNRTVSPENQTAIAEGTRPAFGGGGTPPPEVQTSIAQGTPRPGRFGGQGFAGGRALATVASVLNISTQQLMTELQASGASVETVAAAHGMDRATLRQALIDAFRKRLADAVAGGMLQQDQADQTATQFEQNIDSLIDEVGGGQAFPTPTPGQ